MSQPGARVSKTDEFGIVDGFEDAAFIWQPSPPKTVGVVRELMRAAGATDGGREFVGPIVVRLGETHRRTKPFDVLLEGGGELKGITELPADVPIGYHDVVENGKLRRMIVAPKQCYLPDGLKIWGWTAQLYSVRSKRSWGMGDLADLRALAQWSAELGAKVVLIN